MGYRELVIGDRVRIIGPWHLLHVGGEPYVGRYATYVGLNKNVPSTMPIDIQIDCAGEGIFHWCRKNLRALPRRR